MISPLRYTWFKPVAAIAILMLSFFAGFGLRPILAPEDPHAQLRQSGYRFVSPLLDCSVNHQSAFFAHPTVELFKDIVQRVVNEHLADGSAQAISVYFRDLKSGYWFGTGESERFSPASLMKVPLMMAILKRAEDDPLLLKKKLMHERGGDGSQQQYFKPSETLREGSMYTVDDLLYRMVAYSDNDASLMLADHFGMSIVDEALAQLEISVDTSSQKNDISLRDYSAFFRILFNASYLNNDMSEKALAYLARSTFENGIRAGLPRGIFVASKFGEYSWNPYHLHEVGIVYYPEHPYLLGIATTGGAPESLSHVIEEISKAVFRELDRQHQMAYSTKGRG